MSDQKKTCFFIAPIGEPNSNERRRSDQILEHIIMPVTAARGYAAIRADQIARPGMITDQVVRHLVEDRLVIADLSGRNPNVYYELAIRHVTQKPLIQMIDAAEKPPFDVAGMRLIFFDCHDLDSVKSTKAQLDAQISDVETNPSDSRSPISEAVARGFLASSPKHVVDGWIAHQLHHVSLPVRDVEVSRKFYAEVLGLREVYRPSHFDFAGAWFMLPSGQQVHLLENKDGTYRPNSQADYRDCHFALRVRDFRKAVEYLKSKGHEMRHVWELVVDRYMGGYITDPDGHVIEINTGNHAEVSPEYVVHGAA
jgi:catechol 2,3-dioxygenase-like lactoylglutathione lyase family enzyme